MESLTSSIGPLFLFYLETRSHRHLAFTYRFVLRSGMRVSSVWICENCIRAARPRFSGLHNVQSSTRFISRSSPLLESSQTDKQDEAKEERELSAEEGALSRRLSEMTEEALETGGRSAQKSMRDAGFSEELKKELEEKIAQSSFRAQNQQAFSVAEMPVCTVFFPKVFVFHCLPLSLVFRRGRDKSASCSATLEWH